MQGWKNKVKMCKQTRRPFIVFSFSTTFPFLLVNRSFIPRVGAGIFQVLATTHTVKDNANALNSGIKFKIDILVAKIATACSNWEASRNSAYSHDLRWRIKQAERSFEPVCARSSWQLVCWPLHCFQDYNAIQNNGRHSQETLSIQTSFSKLTEPAQFFVIYLILDRPGIYLGKYS